MIKHLDLFSGIGGFSLAADRVWQGIEHVFCEIDPFCQAVLKKHWPHSKIYGDIRALTNSPGIKQQEGVRLEWEQNEKTAETGNIDILTGGFPCQPFSHAGKRKGTSDDRHLWPEMRRVIQEFSPRWVVGENVRGLLSIDGGMVFESVCTDLETMGYEVQPFVIPACAVNAPHRRDRVWIVARHAEHNGYANPERGKGNGERDQESSGTQEMEQPARPALSRDHATNTAGTRRGQGSEDGGRLSKGKRTMGTKERRGSTDKGGDEWWSEDWPTVATRLCTLDDGLPNGLVRPRGWRNAALKAAGNAIVPQVAEQIFRAIKQLI